MADDKQTNIRYDDFIANVHADPAKPEATIMLAGYIGHGAEGHVRIYPDASLGTWYDVPEADVVHSMPVPDAKLGGSYVWVRSSAAIKPGAAAGAPAAQAPVTLMDACMPKSIFPQICGGLTPPAAGAGVQAQVGMDQSIPCSSPDWGCTQAICITQGCDRAALQVRAQTNPPTLGCTGGCDALGTNLLTRINCGPAQTITCNCMAAAATLAAQTFTMGPLCNSGPCQAVGGQTAWTYTYGCQTMGCHAAAAAAPLGAQTPLTISCACIISLAAHCGAAPLAAQTFTMFCPPFGAPTNPTPVRAGVFTPYGG